MKTKIMGLPLPVWLGVAAAGLLLGLYLRSRTRTSTAVGSGTSYPTSDPNAGYASDIGSAVSGGGVAPTPSGYDPATTNSLLAGLGSSIDQNTATEGNLVDAIGSLIYNVPSSAGSGSSVTGGQARNPVTSTSTTPKTKRQPATKTKAPSGSPKKIHYFTRRKDVTLAHGQSVHFTKGKGYYAA